MSETFTTIIDGQEIRAKSLSEMIAAARVLGYDFKRQRRNGRTYYGLTAGPYAIALSEVPHV